MSQSSARNDSKMRRLREAQARFAEELFAFPGVHGIGIGRKRTDGTKTNELCIVVRVEKKRPLSQLDKSEVIPGRLRFYSRREHRDVTVLTDVQESARPVPYTHVTADLEDRVRPVAGGYSIGAAGGGTLGGWVWDNVTDQIVLLSNEHVLGSTSGTNVLQPSAGDGGSFPADHFGEVLRSGSLDAAVAEPLDGDDVDFAIEGLGPAVYEITDAILDMDVEKTGQTTAHTTGVVELVNYWSNHYGSTSDIEILPVDPADRFAYYGDSGSLIVEQDNPDTNATWKRIVGLLWGGTPSEGNAYAHHIDDVFADLNLTTVCAGIVAAILDSIVAEDFGEEFADFKRKQIYPRRLIQFPVGRYRSELFHRGMSRDLERRLAAGGVGRQVIQLIHANRVGLVNLLRDGDARRAMAAAMGPLVRGALTTDDVLDAEVTIEDIEAFRRFARVAKRVDPELKPALGEAMDLIDAAEGRTLDSVLIKARRVTRKKSKSRK